MKKISIIAAAIALCSCSATKTTDAAVDLNGEWDIVTVDGTAVDTTKTESRPIRGFDTAKDNVFGCAGCNSISGKAKVDAAKQTIKLSQVGPTMMLCANMEYEQKILKALESVKGYKAGKGCVELTNGSGKAVLQLKKQ